MFSGRVVKIYNFIGGVGSGPILVLTLGLIGACCYWPDAARAQETTYTGLCDASAAVAIDDTHFIVGDDERDTLRVYQMGTPSEVAILNLTDYLGNKNKKGEPKEGDIEGATRIGSAVIWITSHGRNKDAEIKEYRWRLFETPVELSGSVPTVRTTQMPPYKNLHSDLIEYDKQHSIGLAAADVYAPKEGGLNIEGLAAVDDDSVYIGFRSPLIIDAQKPDLQEALVIQLSGLKNLMSGKGKQSVLGDPIELDLGGRGIRSMERVGDRYLIVAGPSREDDSADSLKLGFKLFSWSGKPGDDKAVPSDTDFGTLSPEALFEIGPSKQLMVLSDDGGVSINGEKCKEAPQSDKRFRAAIVSP
jgi:hypothetical protein